MITTGRIQQVDYTKGIITVLIDHTGFLVQLIAPSWGNNKGGIQYGLSVNDIVYIDNHDQILYAMHPIADQDSNYEGLEEGDLVIFNSAGCIIYLDNTGNISLIPGTNGIIKLGSRTGKAVVLDGDSVTGTDSAGDTVTGIVHASSTKVHAS